MALRKVSEEELEKILEQHELWLTSYGEKGKKANLSRTDLQGANLKGAILELADLQETDLREANLRGANLQLTDLQGANLLSANLHGANLLAANLHGAIYSNRQLEVAVVVNPKWLKKEINERPVSNKEIEELKEENKKLSEKAKSLEQEREQGKINEKEYRLQNEDLINYNNELNQRLTEAEEEARRDITKDNIDKAINALKNPNTYIKRQINIQNWLATLYGVMALVSFIVVMWYVHNKYSTFDSVDLEKTNFISWLLYVSPILLLGSLVVTLINQVNHRLKRVLVLNERKRYVEAMGGALKATVELTETDADARVKIEKYMDTIVKNTINREIDISSLDKSENEDVKSLELLNKIKDLLKE